MNQAEDPWPVEQLKPLGGALSKWQKGCLKGGLILLLMLMVGGFLLQRMVSNLFGNGPVEFYGVVIDQQEKPVAGAKVGYKVRTSRGWNYTESVGDVMTTADGTFHISGPRGDILKITGIEKTGYRKAEHSEQDTFGYGRIPIPHQPDRRNPQKFLVVGAEMPPAAKAFDFRSIKVVWSQEPIRIPVPDSDITLVLTLNGEPQPGPRIPVDWQVDVAVEGAEIQQVSDGFPFMLAPLTGYQGHLRFAGLKSDPKWTPPLKMNAMIHTKSGNYGFLSLEARLPDREGYSIATVTFRLNRQGNRNVE